MFCHNCGFEIKDQELSECPECNCILFLGLSSCNNHEKEEMFQDIENILNNDELSELHESSGVEEGSEDKDPFALDFETVNQNDQETAANKEIYFAKRAVTIEEMPGTEHPSAGSTMEREDRSTFEEDDETEENNDETSDEIEQKKASKFTFILFFVFSFIIATGAGVLYLKSKQPASPAFPKENASIYENKKSFTIKNEGLQTAVKKATAEETPKIPKQPTMKEASSANKETGAISKKSEPKENKTNEKIFGKDNSWTTYVPGKQAYYTLQISSLSNRSFAQANLNRLKNKQYPAYILLTRNKDGEIVYKLRIGKYETEAKAKRAAELFYKYEKMKYIILKSNADVAL
ncbi:MAG: SPOR domain-containing protein [Flavobacteriaceae bacterium]|nr:MAG: SPOR domain-containing protein [Flavobacteriaceae bacterium]